MNILIVKDDLVIAASIGMIISHASKYLVHVSTIEAALYKLNYNQIDAVVFT